MDDITKTAGYSKATLYAYFENKEDVDAESGAKNSSAVTRKLSKCSDRRICHFKRRTAVLNQINIFISCTYAKYIELKKQDIRHPIRGFVRYENGRLEDAEYTIHIILLILLLVLRIPSPCRCSSSFDVPFFSQLLHDSQT